MAYSDQVIDHYENPRNVGKMDDKSDNVGTGMVGAGFRADADVVARTANDAIWQWHGHRLGC